VYHILKTRIDKWRRWAVAPFSASTRPSLFHLKWRGDGGFRTCKKNK
jgi:hypothetical protein